MVNHNKPRSIKQRFQDFDDAYYHSASGCFLLVLFTLAVIAVASLYFTSYGGLICAAMLVLALCLFVVDAEWRFEQTVDEHKLRCVKCGKPLVTKYQVRPRRGNREQHFGYRRYGDFPKKCLYCHVKISEALGYR